jgi:hypothetical protein
MKFRKKPVVIEAAQWFKHGDHPAVYPAVSKGVETWYAEQVGVDSADLGMIDTLEGPHYVIPGDWIITGVKGEHYPCKPDIFEMTYERVEERTE